MLAHLQRRFTHIGPAWFRRSVDVPSGWTGKTITLELERVLWESRVFVDGREVSRADSLATPHRHDLSAALTPGRHELILQIDNREIHRDVSHHTVRYEVPASFPVAHAYTNHTQTLWNGILGSLRLCAEDRVAVERVAIFPQLSPTPRLEVAVNCANAGSQPVTGTLVLRLQRSGPAKAETPEVVELRQPCEIPAGGGVVCVNWKLPRTVGYHGGVQGLPMLLLVLAAIAFYAMSLAPVTWVVISEIFPNRIRGAAISVAVTVLWIACFILTYTFPILNHTLGPAGTFWLYAGICVAGFIFIAVRLPETKGKSLEQLERDLVE